MAFNVQLEDAGRQQKPLEPWQIAHEKWINREIYVVYDPTYSKKAPSDICTVCKVIRYYDTAHASTYPHANTCTHKDSDYSMGYVIGPNVVQIGPSGKYAEVKKLAAEQISQQGSGSPDSLVFGPYAYKNLNGYNA